MHIRFESGNFHYGEDVRELIDIGESPMASETFLGAVISRCIRQSDIVQQTQLSVAEEKDDGVRRSAGEALVISESAKLTQMMKIREIVVSAVFSQVKPADIIG